MMYLRQIIPVAKQHKSHEQAAQGLCSSAGSARWPTNPVN